MLPCCPALTLTLWLLSARDNTLELNGVSSPRPLLPYSHIAPTHSLRVCLSLSATPLNALTSSSTLNFPPLSLSLCLSPSAQSSPHPVITAGAVRPRLPGPGHALIRHSLLLLHSATAAAVSSFPLSPHCGCASCSRLQGSSVCHRAPPYDVVSHRDYSLIPGDLEIFLRDDVRHVK